MYLWFDFNENETLVLNSNSVVLARHFEKLHNCERPEESNFYFPTQNEDLELPEEIILTIKSRKKTILLE